MSHRAGITVTAAFLALSASSGAGHASTPTVVGQRAGAGPVVLASFSGPYHDGRADYLVGVTMSPVSGQVQLFGSVCSSSCRRIHRMVPGLLTLDAGTVFLALELDELGGALTLRGTREAPQLFWGSCYAQAGPDFELIGTDGGRVRWTSSSPKLEFDVPCNSAASLGFLVMT
jgi:hypothetical protein